LNPFAGFDREMALIAALPVGEWRAITAGSTDAPIRRERARETLLRLGIADHVARTSNTGVQITFRLDFALVYGEALEKARAA
jgi:hypothetical protein